MQWGARITYLGTASLKGKTVPFGIKDVDRTNQVCMVGRSGGGREVMMAHMILQDIDRGLGVVLLDAAGNLATSIIERLTPEQLKRLVYVDASDAEYPFSWNSAEEFRASAYGRTIFPDALASLYGVARGPLIDGAAQKIIADPTLTPLALHAMVEKELKEKKEDSIDDVFDSNPLPITAGDPTTEAVLDNGKYLTKDSMVRNILGQRDGAIHLSALAEGAIVIVDVSRIRIYPTRISPVVKMFVYGARAAAAAVNTNVSLYLHDCLRYLTETDSEKLFADKSVALSLADTIYREEDLALREKSLSRCGTLVSFQPHPSDMPLVSKAFYPFLAHDELQRLDDGEAAIMLGIDGVRSRPFYTSNLELPPLTHVSVQDVFGIARQRYALPRTTVDEMFRPKKPTRAKPPTSAGSPPGTPPADSGASTGAFSDAFRSIFKPKDPPPAQPPAQPQVPQNSEPLPQSAPPPEVDSSIISRLLYVPLPA